MSDVLRLDLQVKRNTTWRQEWLLTDPTTLLPLNLTGYTAKAHLRKRATDTTTPVHTWTSSSGKITLGSNGILTLLCNPVDLSAVTMYRGVYDIMLTAPDAKEVCVAQGTFTIVPEVTRG